MAGLFGKKTTINSTETKLGSLRIQNSSQGLPVPIVIGKTRITSNLLWYGDFTAIPHTTTTESGGKGGSGTTSSNTTYAYTAAVIFGLCEGPVFQSDFISTVWSNKIVTDADALGLSQFTGSYVQNPWTFLTTSHANEARNYRGDAYAAASAFDLGSSDGLPNLSFEVVGLLGDTDQNLSDIGTLLLTADKFGAGWPAAQLGNLAQFNAYCAAAGFLASPAYVAQKPMSDMLSDLAQMGNSGIIWSDGLLKVIPYADTPVGSFTPDLTVQYDLTYDDFIAVPGTDPVKLDRKRQADSYNSVKVECLDRANQYNTAVVEAKDDLAIELYGLRPMEQIQAHEICDPDVARRVAQAILQRSLYVRNIYTFTVGWRYARLEPMDIVSLTDPKLALVQQPVRIVSIDEDEEGKLLMTAEELNIGVSSPGIFSTQTSNGATPQNNASPGNAVAPVMFQPPIALSGKPQVWIGSAGGVNWGGAEVWASNDDTTFQRVGTLAGPARFGTLTANFATGVDPDVTNTLSVDLSTSNGVLVAGSNSVADQLGTLSYLAGANATSGELIAYSAANLTAPYQWGMDGYIRRGQVGSTIQAHANGSAFMRLDDAVSSFDVSPALFGTTIYVKLLSYNTTGNALQGLADVASHSLALQTQIVTNGAGYPYYADRSSTANSPASGNIRFDNASQALAGHVYFHDVDAQGANLATFFSSAGSSGYLDLRDVADTNKWATFTIVSAAVANSVQTFGVVYKAGGAEFPNGDTLVATFSPTPPSGVTSIGLSMPGIFSVANSPITSNGTLAVTFNLSGTSNGQVPTISGNAVVWANQSSSNGGSGGVQINSQTGNYTLVLTDANTSWLEMNSANATLVTVPSNANVAFGNGAVILGCRFGAGSVTIAAQANVTVHNSSSNTLRAQYSTFGLTKRGTDEWVLYGDTT